MLAVSSGPAPREGTLVQRLPRTRRPRARPRRGAATSLLANRNEHVLFEPRQFLVVYVFTDFAVELCQRRIRTVLLELAQHAVAQAGNQQDFFVGRRVQVDGNEQSSVELGALFLRE